MGRTDIAGRKEIEEHRVLVRRDHSVTERLKVVHDLLKAEPEVVRDVLKEDKPRLRLLDHSPNVGPEVSRVGGPESLPRRRERLAGVARREQIHLAAEASAREGRNIVPHRSSTQDLVLHAGHESRRGEGVALTVGQRTIAASEREGDAELHPPNPGT